MDLDLSDIVNYATHALRLVLIASLPAVVAAAGIGLLVALLQALTQVQEQTLAFAFKLIAVILTLYLSLGLISVNFYQFTRHVLEGVATQKIR